jgi:hypothetical protein
VKLWLAVAALVLGAYAYFYQAGGWNQNSRFDLTRAIVEERTSRIDSFDRNTGDESARDGHHYSDKAPGLSWMAIPAYALLRGGGADTAAWGMTVLAVGVPSAIATALLAGFLVGLGARRAYAIAAALAWAFATLAWPYGTLFYGHQTVAALLVIGFCLVGREKYVLAGAVLGLAVVVEYPAALACGVIGIHLLARKRWRDAALLVAGAVPPAIALMLYHLIVFGSATTTPYAFSTQHNRSQGFFMGIGVPAPDALWGITFSSYRGLFISEPWLLCAIPGALRHWKAGRRDLVIVCSAIVLLFVWLNASLVDWQGGWAMGPRYLVPAIPFLVILAAGLYDAPREYLYAACALIGYSLAMMLVGTAVKPEVDVQIQHPFGDFLLPHFFHGEVAVSTQGIEMKGLGATAKAWNLGQQLGLRGLFSLFPLVIWIGGCGAWIVLRLKHERSKDPHLVEPARA